MGGAPNPRHRFPDPRRTEADALSHYRRRPARDDEENLTLAVPSDGGVRSLRAVLDRLDYEQI
ncbi:hypothetical protein ABZ536_33505, partial [Nocardia sp. NPDC019255]